MPEEVYEFTELSYERLAKSAVSPLAARRVLSNPVVRRHIGAALTVAGQDLDGTWLTVAMIEQEDDRYTVTGARYLDDEEIAQIQRIRGERQ